METGVDGLTSPGAQPLQSAAVHFLSECVNIDLHFGNSQEH